MARTSQQKRTLVGMAWPARLDQELRKRFTDELQPKTYFDESKDAYRTTFEPLDSVEVENVLAFIDGFQACVEMVTE